MHVALFYEEILSAIQTSGVSRVTQRYAVTGTFLIGRSLAPIVPGPTR